MRVTPYLLRTTHDLGASIGLLMIRIGMGSLMALSHGLGKVQTLVQGGDITWADPIGIGPVASLVLAGAAEFFCSIALVFGFMTRAATIPLAATMCVAIFIVHADDPFSRQEFPALYLIGFIALLFAGPGRFSADTLIYRKFVAPRLAKAEG